MGFMTESAIRKQAKKGQGETNDRLGTLTEAAAATVDRLDALIVAQSRTNELLEWLVQRLAQPVTG